MATSNGRVDSARSTNSNRSASGGSEEVKGFGDSGKKSAHSTEIKKSISRQNIGSAHSYRVKEMGGDVVFAVGGGGGGGRRKRGVR